MGQCGYFTHVWVSGYETQVFRRLTVVNGTPGIWGVTTMKYRNGPDVGWIGPHISP